MKNIRVSNFHKVLALLLAFATLLPVVFASNIIPFADNYEDAFMRDFAIVDCKGTFKHATILLYKNPSNTNDYIAPKDLPEEFVVEFSFTDSTTGKVWYILDTDKWDNWGDDAAYCYVNADDVILLDTKVVDGEGNEIGEYIIVDGENYDNNFRKYFIARTGLVGNLTYQWQVLYGAKWVDIRGETENQIKLTHGKIHSMMDSSRIYFRCVVTNGQETSYSPMHCIHIQHDVDTVQNDYYAPAQPLFVLETVGNDVMPLEEGDVKKTYNIVINYLFENNEVVADPYTANLAEGSSFSATVTFPTVQGYLPYVGETQRNSIELNYESISEDVTINVVYKPTNVNYTVIHYQQNVDDDQYTVKETETKQGLTGSQVPEVRKTYEGFYNLLYERPAIAADGSTVIEIYYDRYYYLINFDMDGGYGTDPVYARYGAPIGTVNNPTKAGYTFKGWSETEGGTTAVTLPTTMAAENKTYYAIWEVGAPVNYTIVYWKENPDDNGYSYWGHQQKTATAGTVVNGADDIPDSVSNGEKAYFTYSPARTDKDVTVKGDGSTVVNVYYYRNTYNIYFRGISGTCVIEAHTHGTGCNSYLDCQKVEHKQHSEDCKRKTICSFEAHKHVEGECSDYNCGKTEHTHSAVDGSCYTLTCTIENHTHGTGCYEGVGGESLFGTTGKPSNPSEGQVYVGRLGTYIYIKGTWYDYTGSTASGSIAPTTCGKEESNHAHGDDCYALTCTTEAHTHSKDCRSCGMDEHTHTDTCYEYECEIHEHTDDECYRPCTKLQHTHNNNCNSNRTDNVIYVVTAKYQQTIADVWPTADKFPNITLRGWTIDGQDSEAVSKRVTMTSDLCDTRDNLKYAKANTDGYEQYLYYMFESFDQTSPENGNQRKYYNGIYYDRSATYSQVVYSGSSNWGLKPIDGMTAVERVNADLGEYYKSVFLYYKRSKYSLSFYNVNTSVKTVDNIMFEQPLKDYKDSDDKLLSSFVPDYPKTLEPNAYRFAGWYTTPDCFDGTEFDFDKATMPNGNLALYAKWVPVNRTVEFYLTESSTEVYKPATAETEASFTILHGGNIAEEYVKTHLEKSAMNEAKPNGDYTFVMWYYYENGEKKPFDPTMQIRKDLTLYGEWSSNTLKQYTVQYVLQSDHSVKVADDLTGSGLAGTTKTFDAKGGTDLYAAYQEGYFPTVQSQSLLLDIESNSLVITFEYVPMPAVPYTVKYVEKDTGKSLADDKVVSDNRKAVVTETFKPISGYMPDAYQKRLVVTADGENVLYFYYTKDTEHAYYKITHYTQNTDGTTWTEYASSQATGDINTRYTASPMTIRGFTYKETKYVVNGTEVTDVTADGAVLTADGLEINLYYVRNEYPYQVRYLEQGTGKQLADPKKGTGKYGEIISESAIDIDGYDKVDPTSATLNIRIDEGEGAPNLNIITFYYKEKEVTINYVAVGPEGAGSVSPTTETVKLKSGTVQGSTPTAGDGFKFVGWYNDEACKEPVDESWVTDNKIVPQKTNGKNVAATYYAKFEADVTSLTITKALEVGTTADAGTKFVFDVKHGNTLVATVTIAANESVTINGLKVGETYTVTERTDWAWRYEVKCDKTDGKITLAANANGNTITFTNTMNNNQWLDKDSSCVNKFNNNTETPATN